MFFDVINTLFKPVNLNDERIDFANYQSQISIDPSLPVFDGDNINLILCMAYTDIIQTDTD